VLTHEDKQAIRRSWELVVPIAQAAADLFYKRLFELEPAYRELFPPDMAAQKQKLVAMLAFVVRSLDWDQRAWRSAVPADEDLFLVLLALGRRHVEVYRVPDRAYESVGAALLWTLETGLGEAFTPEVRAAWTRVYGLLSSTMKMGRCAGHAETAAAGGSHG
jgi:hemoglobin-like flavoprotein